MINSSFLDASTGLEFECNEKPDFPGQYTVACISMVTDPTLLEISTMYNRIHAAMCNYSTSFSVCVFENTLAVISENGANPIQHIKACDSSYRIFCFGLDKPYVVELSPQANSSFIKATKDSSVDDMGVKPASQDTSFFTTATTLDAVLRDRLDLSTSSMNLSWLSPITGNTYVVHSSKSPTGKWSSILYVNGKVIEAYNGYASGVFVTKDVVVVQVIADSSLLRVIETRKEEYHKNLWNSLMGCIEGPFVSFSLVNDKVTTSCSGIEVEQTCDEFLRSVAVSLDQEVLVTKINLGDYWLLYKEENKRIMLARYTGTSIEEQPVPVAIFDTGTQTLLYRKGMDMKTMQSMTELSAYVKLFGGNYEH